MSDRRERKADAAIRAAFIELLFAVRYETISMSRIATAADVSRSTLYKHYPTREHILEATMDHLNVILADALTSRADKAALRRVLQHLWDNRRLARAVFGPPVDALLRRWIASRVEQRLSGSISATERRLEATQRAGGTVALLEQWLTGRIEATPDEVGQALTASLLTAKSVIDRQEAVDLPDVAEAPDARP